MPFQRRHLHPSRQYQPGPVPGHGPPSNYHLEIGRRFDLWTVERAFPVDSVELHTPCTRQQSPVRREPASRRVRRRARTAPSVPSRIPNTGVPFRASWLVRVGPVPVVSGPNSRNGTGTAARSSAGNHPGGSGSQLKRRRAVALLARYHPRRWQIRFDSFKKSVTWTRSLGAIPDRQDIVRKWVLSIWGGSGLRVDGESTTALRPLQRTLFVEEAVDFPGFAGCSRGASGFATVAGTATTNVWRRRGAGPVVLSLAPFTVGQITRGVTVAGQGGFASLFLAVALVVYTAVLSYPFYRFGGAVREVVCDESPPSNHSLSQ